jgi:hypothetical protein
MNSYYDDDDDAVDSECILSIELWLLIVSNVVNDLFGVIDEDVLLKGWKNE